MLACPLKAADPEHSAPNNLSFPSVKHGASWKIYWQFVVLAKFHWLKFNLLDHHVALIHLLVLDSFSLRFFLNTTITRTSQLEDVVASIAFLLAKKREQQTIFSLRI